LKTSFPDRRSLYRHIEREVLDLATTALAGLGSKQGLAFRRGVGAAPLFVGYALFIAEQSLIDEVDRLYFFTREGEFFQRVFQEVLPSARLANQSLPGSSLLEVSRLATFSPSLRAASIEEMMRLWSLYDSQSIFALARSLGLDPTVLDSVCARQAIPLDEPIVQPWQDARVKRLFQDPDFIRILSDKIGSDRQAALAYFREQGLTGGCGPIGVIDIGWRGTIQDNLAIMLPQQRFIGYYLGLQRFLNPQPPNGVKRAYGPNANRDLLFSHLLDAVSPMEMLCNSPLGSVMGYRFEHGHPRAWRLTYPIENSSHAQVVGHFQNGALFACRHWAPYVESHAIRSGELREKACHLWRNLIERPDRQIAEAYAALNHNDVFGVGAFVDKRVVPSQRSMVRGFFSASDRRAVILFIKQTQWASGLWHRSDLSHQHRAMLISALLAGRAYKRARMWMHYHRVTKRRR
jgi:hypothetical protein